MRLLNVRMFICILYFVLDIGSMASSSADSDDTATRGASRVTALKLLLFYLRLPAPNLAHLLLGFDINKSLRNQTFLNAGTKISYVGGNMSGRNNETEILSIVPRNCLHSIIGIINKLLLKDSTLINRIAITIDYCYETLFILCSNVQYNQQLLSYLRNEFDFINNNLRKVPMLSNMSQSGVENSSHYSIYTWVLNLTCIELQSLIANRMKVNLKKLVQILTENMSSNSLNSAAVLAKNMMQQQQQNANSTRILANSNFDNLIYLNNTTVNNASNIKNELDTFSVSSFDMKPSQAAATAMMNAADTDSPVENKIFELVRFMSFVQVTPEPLNLNYFDQQLVEKVIETCKCTPEFLPFANLQLYDLKKLRSILVYEIRDSAASVGSISRTNLLNEIKSILKNVYDRNQFHLSYFVKKKYFEAIRLLIESLVQLTPSEAFGLNQRYNFLVSLIKRLFQTVCFTFLFTSVIYASYTKCITYYYSRLTMKIWL
jgi:nuclear pore complex protein Nup205